MPSPHERHPLKVLVLEDSNVLQFQLGKIFANNFDAELFPAKSICEAQVICSDHRINLFILDIHLPDGNSLDFLCDVMTNDPKARAIIITATPLPEYKQFSETLNALAFFEKPLREDDFCKVVQNIFGTLEEHPQQLENFQAFITGLTTFDIIQLKCLAHVTQGLEFVSSNDRFGSIYFKKGNIIHAETSQLTGTEALREIISWKSGRMIERDYGSCMQTIFQNWQSALLEAAQAIDETH